MSLTRDGGKPDPKPTSYSPPQGPKDQFTEGPKSFGDRPGGQNHGTSGTQGRH